MPAPKTEREVAEDEMAKRAVRSMLGGAVGVTALSCLPAAVYGGVLWMTGSYPFSIAAAVFEFVGLFVVMSHACRPLMQERAQKGLLP